ncbi:uncharacterized protein SRS1_12405 [Sporisorium reilianum f. sp. reilianum]|uniref:Uncharacterized protein n=1 Tax=Sporisorium reilianum f. sp. reilianum TaxID=72559 RepID=A0A2N8UA57_9BASI|nr:uncharacterized protein SRS1_12405 [Sporisorium reilianum f. sp. reilianum]
MARTGPRGERLTRAQQERLLKQELKGLSHQLEKLEKKAKADEATQDLPELDDHTLEELYQALMLPPPPTAEETRLARLEGGRREKSLQRWMGVEDGRGRRREMLGGAVAGLPPSKAEERRMRASMDLKQRLIDAREKGKMLLPPSAASVRRVEDVPIEQASEVEAAAVEEEQEMAALPYAERQEIRLQQLFARLALVHSSSDPTAPPSSEPGAESLQDIKSNLAHRITKILQEHDYELQSSDQLPTEAAADPETAEPLPPFPEIRLDARAPALETVDAEHVSPSTSISAAADSQSDLVTRAESMINDLSSAESRTFMLDSIEKLVAPPTTTAAPPLPLGVATTEEWTALAVASARANDTATLARTMSLLRAAGYHPAPVSLYNDVMDAFATQGEVDRCQAWLAQMTQLGLEPDEHTYHSLTKAYVNTAQYVRAVELLNSLEASGRPAAMATYTLFIDRLLDPVGAEERPEVQALAWNVFYHMRLHAHAVPDAPLYALMIRACARGVPQPHDIDDPTQRYTSLSASSPTPAPAHARISDAERALDLFREMTTRYAVRPNAEVYNALILVCARRKDFYLDAFRLLREMVELEHARAEGAAAATGLRFAPDRYTFNALLQGCARNRDLARARWVLAEMIRTTMGLFEDGRTMGRDEWVGVVASRPNEETLCHVFHAYAAYVPPVKRAQMQEQASAPSTDTVDASPSTASTATADPAATAPTPLAPSHPHTDLEPSEDATTPDEAAHIFSALVPQTAADVLSESRALFARILADQPTAGTEGPLGAVTPGVRLVNAYLTVLAAHVPVHQRASVLESTLAAAGREEGEMLEYALFAKLGLEPNEHSFRIILESLAGSDGVERVWTRFERFMSYADAAASALVPAPQPRTRDIDAAQVTKCWTAHIHHHAKSANLDAALALLRRFVALYPPHAPASKRRNAKRTQHKAELAARAAVHVRLDPLPLPAKSLLSLLALQTHAAQGSEDAGQGERGLTARPTLSFLDVQLLHHRLVRYARTSDLAFLSWCLHRYAAARRHV